MVRLAPLLVLLVLGGCKELPTAPVFDSPYDPASEGVRRPAAPARPQGRRIGPDALRVDWLDQSSFETGFRVEVARGEASGDAFVFGPFVPATAVPPDVTTATIALDREANAFAVQIVPTGPDGPDGVPSATLFVVRVQGEAITDDSQGATRGQGDVALA